MLTQSLKISTLHLRQKYWDTRYYSTIREDGAESLQGLHETARLPKYHQLISASGCLFICYSPLLTAGNASPHGGGNGYDIENSS